LAKWNQESTMVRTSKSRRTLIAAASLFGIAMALAVPSSAQAQNLHIVSQPPTGHQPSTGGSDGGTGSGTRYAGVLTHRLPYWDGQSQSQGLPPGSPPSAPRRSTKPPL
jgi:hypothetical protein